MEEEYRVNETIKNQNYDGKKLDVAEYENCTFSHCVFSNADLSKLKFVECIFENCDVSMASLKNTFFQDVRFNDCKLLGLRFDECGNSLISFEFNNCVLSFSSFYKLKLKGIGFQNCKLEEVEFVETDLTNAIFENCDFDRAIFENTILKGADFRTSYNFVIDPEGNNIKKAKFSLLGIVGLLYKYDIEVG